MCHPKRNSQRGREYVSLDGSYSAVLYEWRMGRGACWVIEEEWLAVYVHRVELSEVAGPSERLPADLRQKCNVELQ